jgi:hypothetical protein
MVVVEKELLYDYLYQSRHLIVMNVDENYLVLVVLPHVVLDQLSLHVLQFHNKTFHQQYHLEEKKVSVVVKLYFVYSIKQNKRKSSTI